MISNYDDFILEKLIQESILYFSPEMRKKLRMLRGSSISKDLIDSERKNIKDDVTFIDIEEDGYVSYNTMKNATKFLQDTYPGAVDAILVDGNITTNDTIYQHDKGDYHKAPGIYTKSRGKIKFGRLINKILPNKYTANEIEEFTNKWKAASEKKGESFEIVSGDDISYWYNKNTYKNQSGSLGNSCMRASSEGIFKIYTMNPEVCRMLILTDGDGLIGRSIIWKVATKSDGDWEYFMDRQYTTSDEYVEKFRTYAIENGWSFKSANNHHSYTKVAWSIDGGIRFEDVSMSVNLKPYQSDNSYNYGKYPYLDTFRRYDPSTGTLYNDDDSIKGCYLLDDTDGNYTDTEEGVYSEWSDTYIPEDEAVYSDIIDSYLRVDDAVQVERGSRRNRGWYPEGHDSITYDSFCNDYINVDDSVFSEVYECGILADEAVSAITEIDSNGEPNKDESYVYDDDGNFIRIRSLSDLFWYKKLSERSEYWKEDSGHTHIERNLLTKDFEGNMIPKIFSMSIYELESIIADDIDALSNADALLIGAKLKYDTPIIVDKWRYNNEVSKIYPQILDKAKIALNEIQSKDHLNEEEKSNLSKVILERIEEIEDGTWI